MPVSSPAVIAVLLLLASTDRLPKSSAQHEASEHGGVSEYDIPHPDHHVSTIAYMQYESSHIAPDGAGSLFSDFQALVGGSSPSGSSSLHHDNDVSRDPVLTS